MSHHNTEVFNVWSWILLRYLDCYVQLLFSYIFLISIKSYNNYITFNALQSSIIPFLPRIDPQKPYFLSWGSKYHAQDKWSQSEFWSPALCTAVFFRLDGECSHKPSKQNVCMWKDLLPCSLYFPHHQTVFS